MRHVYNQLRADPITFGEDQTHEVETGFVEDDPSQRKLDYRLDPEMMKWNKEMGKKEKDSDKREREREREREERERERR
jgi:hypothetical protein